MWKFVWLFLLVPSLLFAVILFFNSRFWWVYAFFLSLFLPNNEHFSRQFLHEENSAAISTVVANRGKRKKEFLVALKNFVASWGTCQAICFLPHFVAYRGLRCEAGDGAGRLWGRQDRVWGEDSAVWDGEQLTERLGRRTTDAAQLAPLLQFRGSSQTWGVLAASLDTCCGPRSQKKRDYHGALLSVVALSRGHHLLGGNGLVVAKTAMAGTMSKCLCP